MEKDAPADVTRDDIRLLVDAFYRRIRADDRLGPIFAAHVGEEDAQWEPHLAKIEAFWSNVVLREHRYRGNPLAVHQGVREIRDEDFARWLDLFADTARRVLSPAKAEVFETYARRIGRSLQMGLRRVRDDGIPNLR